MLISICTDQSPVCLLASVLPKIFTLCVFKKVLPGGFHCYLSSASYYFLLNCHNTPYQESCSTLPLPHISFCTPQLERKPEHDCPLLRDFQQLLITLKKSDFLPCSSSLKPLSTSTLVTDLFPYHPTFRLSHIDPLNKALEQKALVTSYSPEWCLVHNKHSVNIY